jgi:hypothetical protein
MTPPLDLDALAALCAAATPGPWYDHNPDDEACMNAYVVSTSPIEPCVDTDERINDHALVIALTLLQTPRIACSSDGRWGQNAAFIAASRTALPALLAECRRLRAENERLQTESAANADTARQWHDAYKDRTQQTVALEEEHGRLEKELSTTDEEASDQIGAAIAAIVEERNKNAPRSVATLLPMVVRPVFQIEDKSTPDFGEPPAS